jgi:O-antigen ligase
VDDDVEERTDRQPKDAAHDGNERGHQMSEGNRPSPVHSATVIDVHVTGRVRSPAALPAFGLVLVSLVGFLPSSQRPPLTLLFVTAVLGAAVGLPSLVVLAWRGDRMARLGAGFVLWCLVAAASSGAALAWTGEYFSGTGAVLCLALVGYWAIGRTLPVDAGPAVAAGFLAGAAVNAAVAVLQGVTDLSAASISLYDERSTGLLGNPVFLGAACAAAVALLPMLVRHSLVGALAAALLLAAATQMSGARNSIVVLVGVGIWSAWRCGRRGGPALVVALALGVAGGGLLHGNADTGAAARLQSVTGVGPRVDNWRAGISAAVDRPLTGYGPGRWRAATSSRRTLALARAGADRLYADAHNIGFEYLATTGFPGVALLAAWLVAVAAGLRHTHVPELAVAALALLVFHGVEPMHMTLTPLMLLLAGVAAPRAVVVISTGLARVARVVLVVAALAVGVRTVAGDLTFRSADLDFDLDRMQRASDLLWPWPNPVTEEARIHAFRARTQKDTNQLVAALASAREARRLEPANPLRTIAVAAFLGQLGRHTEAAREYAEALERNPWSRQALTGRAEALRALGLHRWAASCTGATELDQRSDAELRRARADCLFGDAKRERP